MSHNLHSLLNKLWEAILETTMEDLIENWGKELVSYERKNTTILEKQTTMSREISILTKLKKLNSTKRWVGTLRLIQNRTLRPLVRAYARSEGFAAEKFADHDGLCL